jgi:MEDS: MEthanogen/methylotroph, DcmR Sensory domain
MNAASPIYLSDSQVFWGELAPTEHLVYMYEAKDTFLLLLEDFVADGLRNGEAVIVIATEAHRVALNERLEDRGLNLSAVRTNSQYMDLSAETCLATFMKDGWPDETRFNKAVGNLINRASRSGRRVRAFGEMVAMLWANGNSGATVRLEHLWNEFRRTQPFPLFCAYPKSGFTDETDASLREICEAHTKVIFADQGQKNCAVAN